MSEPGLSLWQVPPCNQHPHSTSIPSSSPPSSSPLLRPGLSLWQVPPDQYPPTPFSPLLPSSLTCFSPQCYIGEDTPKMLLLVNAARPQTPETFVVEATAFPGALRFGQLLGACQSAWPYSQVPADSEFHVELRDRQAILNIGGHCQQEGCLTSSLLTVHNFRNAPGMLLRIPTKTGCP